MPIIRYMDTFELHNNAAWLIMRIQWFRRIAGMLGGVSNSNSLYSVSTVCLLSGSGYNEPQRSALSTFQYHGSSSIFLNDKHILGPSGKSSARTE